MFKNTLRVFAVPAIGILLAAGFISCSKKAAPSEKPAETVKGTVTVSGAFALYPLMVRWAEEYGKSYPEVNLEISAGGAGKGMADTLGGMVDVGMISREIYPAELEKGAWPLSVARDAVVGIVHKNSPASAYIETRGVTREDIRSLWLEEAFPAGTAFGFSPHVYTRSDACGAGAVWGEFIGVKQDDLKGIGVFGDPGIVEAVKADIMGAGYGNVNFVYDNKTLKPVDGIKPLPLDLNGDGVLSADEKFYDTRETLTAAIAAGVYPSPPSRALFLVTREKPESPLLIHFLAWILTTGQNYVEESGYIKLPSDIIERQIEALKQ